MALKRIFSNKIFLACIAGIALFVFLFLVVFAFIGMVLGGTGGQFSFGKAVAIIPITGEISSAPSSFSPGLSSNEIIRKIDEAENDPGIGAILFDIDSGGGSIVATKNIAAKIRAAKKPTVAYINDLGASGAFYAAAAAEFIVADEDSLTGSIGVISMVSNYEGLLQKIGIDVNVFTAGKNKAMGNPFEAMGEEGKRIWQGILDNAFLHFKRDILLYRSGKGINEEKFAEISDGRVISGAQALEAGLVDRLGTKDDAINKAAELAGISGKVLTRDFSKKQFSLQDIFSGAGYSFGLGFKKGMLFSEQQSVKAQ